MAGYKNNLFQSEKQHGILVLRVWSYITANKGFVKRSLDYISFAFSASLAALFCKADVIVATSPQFFCACAGFVVAKLKRKPWVFEVRDLWPESIKAVGAMKQSRVIALLHKLELFLYRKANLIVVVTDSFKENLVSRGIAADKIKIIKNGVLKDKFPPLAKDSDLVAKFGLEGKKVLLYAGTIGMAHALDFIVKSAAELKEFEDLHILIMGAGAELENVAKIYDQLKPDNLSLLPAVSREEMPRYLSLADYALVNLRKSDTFKTVLPSKIFESACMGIPIVLGVEGEAKKLIVDYKAGICFEPESIHSFKAALGQIINNQDLYESCKNGCFKLAGDFDRSVLAMKMLHAIKAL